MRISDWSSDVCSSDLRARDRSEIDIAFVAGIDEVAEAKTAPAGERGDRRAKGARLGDEADRPCRRLAGAVLGEGGEDLLEAVQEIGRASCRERVCHDV